jgi:hypothetical protein
MYCVFYQSVGNYTLALTQISVGDRNEAQTPGTTVQIRIKDRIKYRSYT